MNKNKYKKLTPCYHLVHHYFKRYKSQIDAHKQFPQFFTQTKTIRLVISPATTAPS